MTHRLRDRRSSARSSLFFWAYEAVGSLFVKYPVKFSEQVGCAVAQATYISKARVSSRVIKKLQQSTTSSGGTEFDYFLKNS